MSEQPLSDFARQVARRIAISEYGLPVAKVNAEVAAVLLVRGTIARFDKHGTAVVAPLHPGREDVWRATPEGVAEFGRSPW
jgi:hypothetical protein